MSQNIDKMDSPGSNDDRLKFLCSFNGSILPRPLDGKLRYVGGDTRIVSVPKDVNFNELMSKMKELFDNVSVLKYQQPDEDLDALVSVVNDDDVINMIEEYEKLGTGDGFTRLRIFLFSSSDDDMGCFDERDNERRYVVALNSHNEATSGEDDGQLIEQYYNQLSIDGSSYNQLPPVNLQHVRIPPHPQNLGQRYSEMESPWSPAYYSPRHNVSDFPSSPSSSRYHSPYGESYDRVNQEDYFRQPENVVYLPPGPLLGDKAGFPGNILHGSNTGNGPHQVVSPRENYMSNRPFYNEGHPQERAWMMHQANARVDGNNNMNIAAGHPAYPDGNHVPPHYVHHEDRGPRFIRPGPEFVNEIFHDPGMVPGPHVHSPHEESGVWHGNYPNAYAGENLYHAPSHGHVPANAYWRNGQSPVHGRPPYEASGSPQQDNGYVRTTADYSPRLPVGVENQNSWVDSSPKVADYSLNAMPNALNIENQHYIPTEPAQFTPAPTQFTPQSAQLAPGIVNPTQITNSPNYSVPIEPVARSDPAPTLINEKVLSVNVLNTEAQNNSSSATPVSKLDEKDDDEKEKLNSPAKQIIGAKKSDQDNTSVLQSKEREVECLSHAPQPAESVKKVELEGAKEVKAEPQEDATSAAVNDDTEVKEETVQELDAVDAPVDLELDSGSDTQSNAKIEPTKAEEEAIARGLQTIKNDDLEEIRELGSGTYGAVYYGKWKGSDVAIKRIKASCFAGRPSERERLIADFWKEALILSSLHHPNVVSFYGIVRDGPDGSLATVTEFMVNGSLKQFLQKKDRTIDRRKRLIIAMDAAFGMEYLHGKNIVHFDLKCENLLVNMRDPHRPICKIGDLGLSKVKQHTLVSGGVRGTLPWMAPELLSGKSHMVSEKIDVYSFGIVMWELLTGDEPYGDMHCASIIGGIVNNSLRPTIPTWCDPEWKALMESCWSAEPSERPSFSEISQKLRTMAAAINVK